MNDFDLGKCLNITCNTGINSLKGVFGQGGQGAGQGAVRVSGTKNLFKTKELQKWSGWSGLGALLREFEKYKKLGGRKVVRPQKVCILACLNSSFNPDHPDQRERV